MKAYTLCLLALAAFTSARPKPPGGGGPPPGQGQGYRHPKYYEEAQPTKSVGRGEYGGGGGEGRSATTAFPTLSSIGGGYGGAGTGVYQPSAPTGSSASKASHLDTSKYSEAYVQTPDEPNPGNSGSQSLGSGPSSVAGSGSVATGTSSTGTSSTGNTTTGATIGNGKITLPAGCQIVNKIGFGWLPDYNGSSLAIDEKAAGNTHPCFAGYYGQTGLPGWNRGAQITDNIAVSMLTVCEGSECSLTQSFKDATSGGTPYPIFIASVMPQGTPFDQFTTGSAVVTQIADAMTKLTAAGLTVYLRFAHEMNWYDSAAGGYIYTGSSADFQNAWGVVSAAVANIDGVYMYWSPNYATGADLVSSGWWPTQGTVDIVGMDVYPSGGSTFSGEYSDFCTYSAWSSLPFIIGETGSSNGGSTSDKNAWLTQLTSAADLTACPKYLGFSWFEYLKGGTDFRIATGGNTAYEGVL